MKYNKSRYRSTLTDEHLTTSGIHLTSVHLFIQTETLLLPLSTHFFAWVVMPTLHYQMCTSIHLFKFSAHGTDTVRFRNMYSSLYTQRVDVGIWLDRVYTTVGRKSNCGIKKSKTIIVCFTNRFLESWCQLLLFHFSNIPQRNSFQCSLPYNAS